MYIAFQLFLFSAKMHPYIPLLFFLQNVVLLYIMNIALNYINNVIQYCFYGIRSHNVQVPHFTASSFIQCKYY